ncbi:putative disease resistance RPP13-like protein 1 [Humulus lupulus]|uniref:putative disease resistance RPP13-like protein 1 n=1 Tax=Humulus lupulus TaxID=3486 RepID=UPI002B404426|nr:putative disease resistance RPP13-like protein 1 [Humulus lupulus]
MAAELVIGAFLSASFDLLLEKIASPCVEELIFLTGNKSSVSERLCKLKSTFNCLTAVRFEVENKKIKNPGVENWLDNLLDAVDKNVSEVKPSETLLVKTSLVDEHEVYGRESDKDALMKLLMIDDVGSQKICAIPILGMGGVGKTTLAQALFNDERVKNMFEHMAWVNVSDKFDAVAMTKSILEEVAQGGTFSNMNSNSLQNILDDAWEDSYVRWSELMKPFINGAKGSKIIVTTRNKTVADSIRTTDAHHLGELSEDECWGLFAKHASSGNLRMFIENPKLESIGRKVTKKCKGLPLAAKVLGGLLRSTLDAER